MNNDDKCDREILYSKELGSNNPELLMPGERFNWYYRERNKAQETEEHIFSLDLNKKINLPRKRPTAMVHLRWIEN